MLTTELRKKLGEVETAKVLRDWNLLIICKPEEQRNKAKQVESIHKKCECVSVSSGIFKAAWQSSMENTVKVNCSMVDKLFHGGV